MILNSRFLFSVLAVTMTFAPQWASAEMMGNTYVGGVYQNYTGDRENSLAGVSGYGLTVLATPHRQHFRLLYGATLSFGDGRGYVQSARYGTTLYSADAIIGFSIYPIINRHIAIRPFIEASGLGGFKYLEISNPPVGVDGQSTGLSYGYRLAIGLETDLSLRTGLRMTAEYLNNRANMANTNSFQFDTFAFTLGLFF